MSDVFFRQMELGPMANYVYLVGDPATKECAVVDPGWEAAEIAREAEEAGYRITQAWVTHHHFDHIGALKDLLRRADVPVYVHKDDAFALQDLGKSVKPVSGGDRARLGGLEVEFLHTPGHTQGSQCFLLRGRLLTGDTLFVRGCGRVDLEGSDPEKMYHSLRRLSSLPDDVVLFPGHNYSEEKSAALGVERGQNPYVQAALRLSPAEFRSLVGF